MDWEVVVHDSNTRHFDWIDSKAGVWDSNTGYLIYTIWDQLFYIILKYTSLGARALHVKIESCSTLFF